MEDNHFQPQTRLTVLVGLLKIGVLWGVLVALMGAGIGFFAVQPNLTGVLRGINGAGLGAAVMAGLFVIGHSKGRAVTSISPHSYELLPPPPYPWASIVVALVASAVCGLIWLLLRNLS